MGVYKKNNSLLELNRNVMKDYTSIRVSHATKSRIKGLALTSTETFDHILLRLLDTKLKGREISYKLKDKNSSHELGVKVDWGNPEQNILYYDDENNLMSEIPGCSSNNESSIEKWVLFIDNIKKLDNLFYILSVLDVDESIDAGEFIISRVS